MYFNTITSSAPWYRDWGDVTYQENPLKKYRINIPVSKSVYDIIMDAATSYDVTNKITQKTESVPVPVRAIINRPATILFWPDGTKTVVKCQDGDRFDPEKGVAMAMLKKYLGGTGRYNDVLRNLVGDKSAEEAEASN